MKPCGHAEPVSDCRVCFWCADNSETGLAYRELWGEMPRAVREFDCHWLGEPTGELTDECGTCPGLKKKLKVFACGHTEHGPTTTAAKCRTCPGYLSLTPVPRIE
jgi:hypothetical protein